MDPLRSSLGRALHFTPFDAAGVDSKQLTQSGKLYTAHLGVAPRLGYQPTSLVDIFPNSGSVILKYWQLIRLKTVRAK